MLLTAFCCKNFAITIFTWGSLWVETLFFLLLFDQSCRFPRCSNSKLSLSISSVVQSKKVGRDMNTHLRRRSYAPRQTAPLGPSHFLSKTFSWPAFRGQPFVSNDRWPRCTLWNRFSVPLSVEKAPKTASKLHAQGRSGPQRSKKITRTLTLTGRPRARTPSSSTSAAVFSIAGARIQPCAFSSAIYSCLGDLATCFTCLHKSKQAKKAHVVCEPWAWPSKFKHACSLSCMQHTPACITCMHSRSTQITGMVTSIVALRFARTPRPLCHSWKNSFPFVLGTAAESPESSLRSYLWLPRPDDRRSIPVTGSAVKAAVRCLLLTTNEADNKHHALAKSPSLFETSSQKTNRRHPAPFPNTNEVECMPATSLHDLLDSMHDTRSQL